MTPSRAWFTAEHEHRGRSLRTLRGNNGLGVGGCRTSRRRLSLVAALLFVTALLAPAIAQARDLVVFGEPTLEKALKSVGTLWQTRTGTRVNVFVAPTDLSYAQIERGARCDVIFALAGAATDDAARGKIIHADTIRRALRNSLVLVGSDPGATPRSNAHSGRHRQADREQKTCHRQSRPRCGGCPRTGSAAQARYHRRR